MLRHAVNENTQFYEAVGQTIVEALENALAGIKEIQHEYSYIEVHTQVFDGDYLVSVYAS